MPLRLCPRGKVVLLYNCFHLLDALPSILFNGPENSHVIHSLLPTHHSCCHKRCLLLSKMYPFSLAFKFQSQGIQARTMSALGPEVLSLSIINIWGWIILFWEAVLCTVGGIAASLTCSTNHCPPHQVVTTKMSLRGKTAPAEKHCSSLMMTPHLPFFLPHWGGRANHKASVSSFSSGHQSIASLYFLTFSMRREAYERRGLYLSVCDFSTRGD